MFAKSNIDRKDGSLYGHKPSDVNQLTPNFHDFLNLPVKYNPEKYVYPLISSSYANTKIQGNVVKQHNHKDYSGTTYKPTMSPTYYTTKHYMNKSTKKPTISLTTSTNLMGNQMSHPKFDDNQLHKTKKPIVELTTQSTKVNNILLTTNTPKTTTKVMSFFEQLLFGNYDDQETTTLHLTKTYPETTAKTTTRTTTTTTKATTKAHSYYHSETDQDFNYDYDDYNNEYVTDNIAVESKPVEKVTLKPFFNSEKEYNLDTTSNKQEITTTTYKPIETIKLNEMFTKETTTDKTDSKVKLDVKIKDKYKTELKKPIEKKETILDDSYFTKPNKSAIETTTKSSSPTTKVTSLPLGENHIMNNRQPIIVTTNNLKEQLNNEKVPFTPYIKESPPSTSNIHIAPDQDIVSFVVGNQQSVDGSQYAPTGNFKESPYDHNPFRPIYPDKENTFTNYHIANEPEPSGSVINIQPTKNTEASLTIGKPLNNVKNKIPGKVVDDDLNLPDKSYTLGSKIVFPDDKLTTTTPDINMVKVHQKLPLFNNREVLKLNSKPMFHQLPSDLTPPNQAHKEVSIPNRLDRIRPPWDPRPGHFYSGRPEYARPPRPPVPPPTNSEIYKRLDHLPNILPQFRPNARISAGPYYYDNYKKPFLRQPLLERPSNKPIELIENLQPPPLPKNPYGTRPIEYDVKLRHNLPLEEPTSNTKFESDSSEITKKLDDQMEFYQSPPKAVIANKRISDETAEVETLQMIQAKSEKKENNEPPIVVKANETDSSEKPLYVVYPVNTPPLKLDAIDNNKKESVVIGTRAELPLPPSEIKQFTYEQTPLLNAKDRNDAPILKPHPKPASFPIRSDFPYHIERPDPSVLNPAVPDIPANDVNEKYTPEFTSNNQWNTLDDAEARIVNDSKQQNQISATLKTFTDKPIAVAYTPTEPHYKEYNSDKFSMPNYGGAVIPEIRPGDNSEFTVSAVMHTHPHMDFATQNMEFFTKHKTDNHRIDNEMYTTHVPPQEFQAPFQASLNLDHQSMSQGWTVIRDTKNKTDSSTLEPEVTTLPIATTSEFDIENFKPKLIGGFKPLYNFPEDDVKKDTNIHDREE